MFEQTWWAQKKDLTVIIEEIVKLGTHHALITY